MKDREFLKKHFPGLNGEALQVEMKLMSSTLICEGSHLEMVVKNKNIKAVEDMRRGFLQFWRGYTGLDPTLIKFVKAPSHSEICNFYWQLTGFDPTNYFPRIEGMKEEYPTDTGAFERLIGAIEEEATHIHYHTKEQDYLHKAALVQFARAQWLRITKKKSAIKPSLTSPFYKYLIDLVKYVDQTWSLDTLLRAERRIRE